MVLTVDFVLDGQEFTAINGGPDMLELLNDPDPARSRRAMTAMMGMVKLDVATLRAAADGTA